MAKFALLASFASLGVDEGAWFARPETMVSGTCAGQRLTQTPKHLGEAQDRNRLRFAHQWSNRRRQCRLLRVLLKVWLKLLLEIGHEHPVLPCFRLRKVLREFLRIDVLLHIIHRCQCRQCQICAASG